MTILNDNSSNCLSDTSLGASVNKQVAEAVLGKAIVSRKLVLFVSNITESI